MDNETRQALWIKSEEEFQRAKKTSYELLEATVSQRELENKKLRREITKKEREVKGLAETIRKRDRQLKRYIKKHGRDLCGSRQRKEKWQDCAKRGQMDKAYRSACKENNLSQGPLRHGLRYVPPPVKEEDEDYEINSDTAKLEETTKSEGLPITQPFLDPTAAFNPTKTFNFERLLREAPIAVNMIAKYTMTKDGPIHVIVRLDKHDVYPPAQGGLDRLTNLQFRFHWGGTDCAINSSPLPKEVLSPLLVGRYWLEIFGNCFYATNTFSFQSLGEFGVFMERIGRARGQRLQHINLWWIGSKMEKNPRGINGKRDRYARRQWSLRSLVRMRRLKNLNIFLDESAKNRVRRRYEPSFVKSRLLEATKNFQNNRRYRDLRKLLGLDYLLQLRGVRSVEIYDYNAYEPMTKVHDQSFVDELRRHILKPKSPEKILKSKVENLQPMLKSNWKAPSRVRKLIYQFFDETSVKTGSDHVSHLKDEVIFKEKIGIKKENPGIEMAHPHRETLLMDGLSRSGETNEENSDENASLFIPEQTSSPKNLSQVTPNGSFFTVNRQWQWPSALGIQAELVRNHYEQNPTPPTEVSLGSRRPSNVIQYG